MFLIIVKRVQKYKLKTLMCQHAFGAHIEKQHNDSAVSLTWLHLSTFQMLNSCHRAA